MKGAYKNYLRNGPAIIKQNIKEKFLSKTITVPISQCVHYCAFRYGLQEYNPYETYITELHKGKPESYTNGRFIEFLQYYRPSSFGEAIGISLSRDYALWQYPWSSKIDLEYNAHNMKHDMIPDIITHFSAEGIPFEIIKKEFNALRNAYHSIVDNGYQPENFGYAEVLCLQGENTRAYLLLDGNHRVSALSALGHEHFEAKLYRKHIVSRKDVAKWYGVKNGIYSAGDALKIFDAYFSGNKKYRISSVPAPIIY